MSDQPAITMYGFTESVRMDYNLDHDRYLYHVARTPDCEKVTSLDLGGDITSDYPRFSYVSDDTLLNIAQTFPNLDNLCIDANLSITAAGVAHLTKLAK